MAKRKCLKKRSSGYSRHSAGSAILNSDTEILGDEHPYWWKDLENNSITRPSIDSNILSNQTSRQLDSTSQIETSGVSDDWWKVLEVSNIQNSSKIDMHNMQKDSNNVSASESEEESRIVKRKFRLHSETRKSKRNIFLNVLNDPETTTHKNAERESSMNTIALSSNTNTNIKQVNEIQESSSDQSDITNVLKLKPNIYKKNYKNRNKNVFSDVLKENQSGTSSKRKISSTNEAQITTESADFAASEDIVLSQQVLNQFAFSFANEHNFSPALVPKAQSTILEGSTLSVHNSNKESNNSDTINKILKPKTKLLTRNRKNRKQNLFENVFKKEESLNKEEKNVTTDEILKHSLKSSKNPKAAADTMDEHRYGDMKGVETLSTKISEDSSTSNDESDISQDYSRVQRSKSRFLTRLRKNRKKNPFRDIFEGNNDVDALITPPSERTLIRSREKVSIIKNATSIPNIFRRKSNHTSSNDSMYLRIEKSDEDVAMNIKSDGTDTNMIDTLPEKNTRKKQPSLPKTDAKLDDVKNVSKKRILNVNNTATQSLLQRSDSLAAANATAIELAKAQDTLIKQSSHVSKLEKSFSDNDGESKRQETKIILQRRSIRFGNKKKESVLPATNEDKSSEIQDNSKRINKSSSIRSLSRTQDDKTEQHSTKDILNSQSKRSNRLEKHSVSVMREDMTEGLIKDSIAKQEDNVNKATRQFENAVKNISNRQSNISDKARRRTRSSNKLDTSSESEMGEDMTEGLIKSSSAKQENNLSKATRQFENAVKSISNRQSNISDKARRRTRISNKLDTSSESEMEEDMTEGLIKGSSAKQENNASKATRQFENAVKNISNRQSNISDRARRRTRSSNKLDTSSESEMEEGMTEGLIKSSSAKQENNVSKATRQFENAVKSISSRQSNISDKARRGTRTSNKLDTSSESEMEEGMAEGLIRDSTAKQENNLSKATRQFENVLKNVSSRQSNISDKARRGTRLSNKLDTSSESEMGEDMTEGLMKSSSAKQENNVSKATRQFENVLKNVSSRQSNISDKARRRTRSSNKLDTSSKSEMDEIACSPKRQKKMHLDELSEDKSDPVKNQDDIKKQFVNDHFDILGDQTILSSTNKSIASSDKIYKNVNSLNRLVDGDNGRKKLHNRFASGSNISTCKKDGSTLNFAAGNLSKEKERTSSGSRSEEMENRSEHSDENENYVGKPSSTSALYLSVSKGQKIVKNHKGASSKAEHLTSSVIRTRIDTERNVSKRQQTIRNFLISDKILPASQVSTNQEKIAEVKRELERMKTLEIAQTKENGKKSETKPATLRKDINMAGKDKKLTSRKQRLAKAAKPTHKAFLVNGQVYKVKRRLRPQYWITDRLYNYLSKRLEPKYKLETKNILEKFVRQLSDVTKFITKCKSYMFYKFELTSLMKEMARLGIIHTRNDFYNFAHDFFPYYIRVKTVPMLLPGNKRNIPYDVKQLHEPLFDS